MIIASLILVYINNNYLHEPDGLDLRGDVVFPEHLKPDLLEQLRKTPRIEPMQNFTDTARDFIITEALHNQEVSDLLLGYDYEINCCGFAPDRNEISNNRYVGVSFDIPEKYATVVVTYDLAKQQISGVSTEILLEDGIIKVGEKEDED